MGNTVAFLGLGAMGAPMATNLLKAGFTVNVWNRSPARCEPLGRLGATVCDRIGQAVADADFVVSIIADDQATREVMLGTQGVVASARPGTIIIDSSTNTPAMAREVARAAKDHGINYLDAPVSGSIGQASSAELVFMVGGELAAFEAAQPVLAAMGKSFVHMGASGSGATIKLINNMMSGTLNTVIAEAVTVAEAAGLDPERVMQLLAEGAVASRLSKTKLPKAFKRDFSPQFQLGLMEKDLRYFVSLAQELDCPVPVASIVRHQLHAARRAGLGALDVSAVLLQLTGEKPAR